MDGQITIGTKLETSDFDRQIQMLTDYLKDLEDDYNRIANEKPFEGQTEQLKKMSAEILSTKKKLVSLKVEKDKLNQTGFQNILNSVNNIGGSIEGIIKKIGRWTLAIFGIRSAYMLIRQSMSTLSQYNEQLATDVEYIRFAIASALQPIIERIIQLVYKLLSLIGAISKALIGKNIFENSGIDKFSKGMASSAKSAKEMNKQLAKFDEMNVLQDPSSGGAGAGGGVANITPSMDLSKIDTEAEEYVEKMKNVADTVTSFWEEEWKSWFNNATGNWAKFFQGLLLSLEGFYLVFKGIFEIIGGIIDIFVGIFTGDIDKMKTGWDKMVKGLFDIFKGILDLIVGVFLLFKGIVEGIILTLWDGIKAIVSGVGKWVYDNIIKPIANFFVGLWDGIKNGVKSAFEFIKNIFNSIVNFFKNIISNLINLFKTIGTKVGEVVGGAFKTVINAVLKSIESILNAPIKAINKLTDVINKVPGINLGKLDTFKLPRLARGGIVNNPGPGVMMGSYVAGESGPEAVLPLTDDTLQRLANMIPITVNVTNTMNGRVLSRELQKVQNESNFAFNR